MADILNTAQNNNPLAASPLPDDVPMAPTESAPQPQANPSDILPPEPSPQPEETEAVASASPSDSLIVPPKEGQKPPKSAPVREKSPPPVPVTSKKSPVGVILAALLLLLITLPLAVFFISQQKQLADVRSRAAAIQGPYPPWSSCSNAGDKTVDSKGNCLECKIRNIYTTPPELAWVPCGGTDNCPWTPKNGKCCPVSPDACSTLGSIVCIKDPYASKCEVWDTSCPAGQQYYYKAFDWCDETKDPGCYETYIKKKYGCEPGTGTPPPTSPSASPTPGGQCTNIEVYKDGTMVTDFSTLTAGDVIAVWVKGTNATKAHVRINGGAWTETTLTKTTDNDPANTWYIVPNITIPTGVTSITIESEVYVNGVWE